jgi:hypothetical protein
MTLGGRIRTDQIADSKQFFGAIEFSMDEIPAAYAETPLTGADGR